MRILKPGLLLGELLICKLACPFATLLVYGNAWWLRAEWWLFEALVLMAGMLPDPEQARRCQLLACHTPRAWGRVTT